MGRDSSVGIATRYGLDGPGIESWWGARFSAPVQTGPGTYPAPYTMGTESFPGVKRSERGADHLPPSKCRGHERVGLYLYSPAGPQWPVIGRIFTNVLYFSEFKILVYVGVANESFRTMYKANMCPTHIKQAKAQVDRPSPNLNLQLNCRPVIKINC